MRGNKSLKMSTHAETSQALRRSRKKSFPTRSRSLRNRKTRAKIKTRNRLRMRRCRVSRMLIRLKRKSHSPDADLTCS